MYGLKAVITTRYGKESQAALEVGDLLYPHDPLVKIGRSAYGGVILIYSSLEFDKIITILRGSTLVHVRRIIRVDRCCPSDREGLIKCVNEFLSNTPTKILHIKISRRGSIKKYVNELRGAIKVVFDKSSNNVLHIEPINSKVCIGIMRVNEDRLMKV